MDEKELRENIDHNVNLGIMLLSQFKLMSNGQWLPRADNSEKGWIKVADCRFHISNVWLNHAYNALRDHPHFKIYELITNSSILLIKWSYSFDEKGQRQVIDLKRIYVKETFLETREAFNYRFLSEIAINYLEALKAHG